MFQKNEHNLECVVLGVWTVLLNVFFLFVPGNTLSCQSWMWKFWKPWICTTSSWTRLPSTRRTPKCSNSIRTPQPWACRWGNETKSVQLINVWWAETSGCVSASLWLLGLVKVADLWALPANHDTSAWIWYYDTRALFGQGWNPFVRPESIQ